MPRDTRSALVDAAQASFATHGYAGTSIRRLAAAVGIKESSVYNHFPGKAALLEAVLERADASIAAAAARLGVSMTDPHAAAPAYATIDLDGLDRLATGFLDVWLHDPDVVAARRVLTLEQYRLPQAARRLRELTVEEPLAFQTALFAELIGRGAFRAADPRAVALAFWGPVVAILASAEGPDAEPAEAQARERLHAHLAHFRDTHVAAPKEES